MNFDDKTYNKIKAYLDDEMTNKERVNFELEIDNNEDLKNTISVLKTMPSIYNEEDWALYDGDLNTLKETANLFKGEDIEHFSKQVRTVESNYNTKNTRKRRGFIKYISSIAAAALILFSGYYFLNDNTSNLDLYNDYYNLGDLPSFTTQSNTINILAEAENLFKTKQYAKALEQFKIAESALDSTLNPNLELYIALCYLKLEQYDLAHKRLDVLLKSNTLDAHKSYWFKALTYLKQDNKARAIETLKVLLKKKTNFNYNKAKALLNELN